MYDLRIFAAIGILLFGFLGGWWVNGARWDAKYQTVIRVHAEEAEEAQRDARAREQALQSEHEATEKAKDEKIRNLDSKLATTLDRLRQREARPNGGVPQTSCTEGSPKGATGAQLFREDGEFLAREAARADKLAVELEACYSAYNAARKP